jgi:hypothetical protein
MFEKIEEIKRTFVPGKIYKDNSGNIVVQNKNNRREGFNIEILEKEETFLLLEVQETSLSHEYFWIKILFCDKPRIGYLRVYPFSQAQDFQRVISFG